MTEQLGPAITVDGERLQAFPGPSQLRRLGGFPGLFGRKVEYLQRLAEAAMKGRLDAARLRSMPPEEALTDLKTLPGIGDFSAELILLRGAGEPDYLGLHEPRLRRAVALAYGLPRLPSDKELLEISERWRPYRTWVSVLMRPLWPKRRGSDPAQ